MQSMGHSRVYNACLSSAGKPDRQTKPRGKEGASPQDRWEWWTTTRLGWWRKSALTVRSSTKLCSALHWQSITRSHCELENTFSPETSPYPTPLKNTSPNLPRNGLGPSPDSKGAVVTFSFSNDQGEKTSSSTSTPWRGCRNNHLLRPRTPPSSRLTCRTRLCHFPSCWPHLALGLHRLPRRHESRARQSTSELQKRTCYHKLCRFFCY